MNFTELTILTSFTVDLLMFANKYCIKSLVKVIANYLANNINMENVYPVIRAAYFMDNDDLLKEASKFIGKNQGQFQDNEEWQQLQIVFKSESE